MSTPCDEAAFREHAGPLQPTTVLYCGIHDRRTVANAYAVWPRAVFQSLDMDASLCPDILCDLDSAFTLRGRWDVIVAAYVLMYVEDPCAAIRRLLRYCGTLVVQENVIRRRPDNDPWRDRNRFICSEASLEERERAAQEASCGEQRLVDLSEFNNTVHYYDNPPGVSALWLIRP